MPGRKPADMLAFLACDGSSLEPASHKTNLFGLFDVIYIESFPSIFRPFSLFVKLANAPRRIRGEIRGYTPDGKQFGAAKIKMSASAKDAKAATGFILQVGPVPIPQPGIMHFDLEIDGVVIGWPCEIEVKDKVPKNLKIK